MIPQELKHFRRKDVPTEGLPADSTHDPSNILFADGLYYLWHTQHRNDRPCDHYTDRKIMCVTSPDSETWSEGVDALLPGQPGSWDEVGVLTAHVTPCTATGNGGFTTKATTSARPRRTTRCWRGLQRPYRRAPYPL